MTTLIPPKKNTAFSFELDVFDYSGKFLTGAIFSAAQVGKDGGSFAPLTNAPVEIGTSGVYTIALTSGEMNADRVKGRLVISGAPDIGFDLFTSARTVDDLAFPASSGQSLDVDASGRVNVGKWLGSVVNALISGRVDANAEVVGDKTGYALTSGEHTNVAADVQSGLTAQGYTSTRGGYLDRLNSYVDSALSAIKAVVDAVKAKTDNLPVSPAATGAQMDLVNAPNATAVAAIQNGLATASAVTAVLNRLGAWAGGGRNTILGAFQALFRKDALATIPSDINANLGGGAGAALNSTDSLEAIRDRGDAAWVTGAGGSAPTAAEVADEVQTRTIAAVTAVDHVTGAVGSVSGAVGSVSGNVGGNVQGSVNGNLIGNVNGNVLGEVPDSAGVTSLLARLTAARAGYLDSLAGWAGTLLEALRALARKDGSSVDIGGTFDPATDSLEALREKVDTLTPGSPVDMSVDIQELNQ